MDAYHSYDTRILQPEENGKVVRTMKECKYFVFNASSMVMLTIYEGYRHC